MSDPKFGPNEEAEQAAAAEAGSLDGDGLKLGGGLAKQAESTKHSTCEQAKTVNGTSLQRVRRTS